MLLVQVKVWERVGIGVRVWVRVWVRIGVVVVVGDRAGAGLRE
jgi:hypothetical protein